MEAMLMMVRPRTARIVPEETREFHVISWICPISALQIRRGFTNM